MHTHVGRYLRARRAQSKMSRQERQAGRGAAAAQPPGPGRTHLCGVARRLAERADRQLVGRRRRLHLEEAFRADALVAAAAAVQQRVVQEADGALLLRGEQRGGGPEGKGEAGGSGRLRRRVCMAPASSGCAHAMTAAAPCMHAGCPGKRLCHQLIQALTALPALPAPR